MPHQSGFLRSVVFTSGSQETKRKGPVPLALREAKVSSAFLNSCGLSAPFFSAHARLMIMIVFTYSRRIGAGPGVAISTV